MNAIFFDRDGILNKSIIKNNKPYPPYSVFELEIIKEIFSIMHFCEKNNILKLVITNQPDVSRGKCTMKDIEAINDVLKDKLKLDEIFTCYHDNKDLCDCRKPKPGAFFYYRDKYDINLKKSIMIGDRKKDIDAAYNAGCPSIFVDYDYDEDKPNTQISTVSNIQGLLPILEKHYEPHIRDF